MTPDQARTAYKMARMAFNQYRREIATALAYGFVTALCVTAFWALLIVTP